MGFWRFLCCLLLVLTTEASHAISDRAATEQVAAQLLASVDSVSPGSEIYLGVNQKIIPHWHTYWSNPGDSGLATTISWKLPEGASASDILWPIPGRISLGTITNYGYSNEVTLLSKITVPTTVLVGSQFTVEATVDWLVCNEECIPQQVELSLSLPVVTSARPASSGSPLIQQALAQLPVTSPWPASVDAATGELNLHIGISEAQAKNIKDIWFYPADWGVIAQNADQPKQITASAISLKLKTGEVPLKPNQPLKGVLVVTEQTPEGVIATGFNLELTPTTPATEKAPEIGFVSALLLALVGGLILNLMPCVFPVLSLKALSLVRHADHAPEEVRLQGWVYTAGVLVSFSLLAAILVILKAGGAQIGWGFQFQSPLFVILVAYLMFVVGLNLSSVFVIGGSIAGVGSSLADRKGYSGSFFTGVLATIAATPCTAPFMAAALGYALSQPSAKLFAIFLSLGFGLALPYLLLANWPRLQSWLPRPGAWMEVTKQAFAFPMYATAAWLVWVLAQQAGPNAVIIALVGMVALSFAAWLYNTTRNASPRTERVGTIAALAIVVAIIFTSYRGLETYATANLANESSSEQKNWEAYTPARLESLLAEGKPVFLNFTASWCISCLVNERVALSNSTVVNAFSANKITYLKGDWTKRDAEITAILTKFGRSGVPLYVFYPAGKNSKPIKLPQLLTPDIVLSTITTQQ
ncbi:thiol:disulfide interchange protein DsbD [Cellvibrio zantedeschiae]|uniref:Thiol:disulfide interchange protein DsbD n=1 Tax=Cellvibrio zantedeschiae TaxID=1237077 RepID=A0ABQ3AYD2_9GAMM|nr:thioredoxin family protein [Cellvibrio zantedeschiae]GGY71679.1 thiol:disulfide interchange protein DsbD [Cellvibrio zantedeschiae]